MMPSNRLTISSVETAPLRVPLARVFHGSHYRMTHRSTIVTRITTEEGIVGEAYAGTKNACDVRMAHQEEPQVASHLLASIPHGTFVECFHPDRDPIWWNLVANRPPLSDGAIELTEAPGLGWEMDEDFIDAHRVRR